MTISKCEEMPMNHFTPKIFILSHMLWQPIGNPEMQLATVMDGNENITNSTTVKHLLSLPLVLCKGYYPIQLSKQTVLYYVYDSISITDSVHFPAVPHYRTRRKKINDRSRHCSTGLEHRQSRLNSNTRFKHYIVKFL